MKELDLQALDDGSPPDNMDASECITYLANRVLAADILVDAYKLLLDDLVTHGGYNYEDDCAGDMVAIYQYEATK